jgi:hypothetical protein
VCPVPCILIRRVPFFQFRLTEARPHKTQKVPGVFFAGCAKLRRNRRALPLWSLQRRKRRRGGGRGKQDALCECACGGVLHVRPQYWGMTGLLAA